MSWSDGYFTDLEYTYGYYKDLNPSALRFACLAAGVEPPPTENLTYLELGFGQGVSINIHAAASGGEFWGTDFNPTQASHAASLHKASSANVHLFDESFEEFAARDDLPQFNVIALHGIWSWISERNRGFITQIIRKNLRIGGIVYLSYNCLPGWAASMPIRHLMKIHTEYAGSDIAGPAGKIDAAVNFAQKVADSGAFYFSNNPSLANYMKRINEHGRNYLAHEYFNLDWSILNFSDVVADLERAKVAFVTSAQLMDHMDEYHMGPDAQTLLSEIGHPILKESVRDYVVNQQFRRDIFAKGPRRLSGMELRETWLKERFTLVNLPNKISLTTQGPLGELTLHEEIYRPIIDILATDGFAPKSVREIMAHPNLAALDIGKLIGAILVLVGFGNVQLAQQPTETTRRQCRKLNRHLCQRALTGSEISSLVSPILGGGITVPPEHQMIMLAILDGQKTPVDQAKYLNAIFEGAGSLSKNGKPLAVGEATRNEFKSISENFSKEGGQDLLTALEII
jgi:hypothetical protein